MQTFLNLLQEHGGIGVQDAVPAGMAPIDAVHAGAVPAGPIPAIAVAAAPDAVPAGRARGRARGRGQARGRGRGRAQGEDEQGLTMQLQMQTQKLMKVAKLTNQILMLKPIRRIGGPEVAASTWPFASSAGPASQIKQNKAYNKSGRGRTVDHLFPDGNGEQAKARGKGAWKQRTNAAIVRAGFSDENAGCRQIAQEVDGASHTNAGASRYAATMGRWQASRSSRSGG